jgi:release factor glutamine methyltransferase
MPKDTVFAAPVIPSINLYLQWAVKFLEQSKIPNARFDAEILLVHVLKCTRIDLYKSPDWIINPRAGKSFRKLIKRRCHDYPVAYIIGHAEFMSLDFKVSPAVLIPRPETEFVVEEALNIIKHNSFDSVMDIGTGSGNIIISLAKLTANQRIKFWASDISPRALKVARTNARHHKVAGQIKFVQGDLFEAFKNRRLEHKIDLLICNPPYVARQDKHLLAPGVRLFEPAAALYAGQTGLDFYRRIISEAIDYLRPGGYMVLELGYNQAKQVQEIFASTGCFDRIKIIKDLRGIKRVISVRIGKA